MRRVMLFSLLAIAACTPAPKGPSGYRDPSRMIASAALFDPGRFAGQWNTVAAFGGDASCGRLTEEWTAGASGYAIKGTTCNGGKLYSFTTNGKLTGPGRIVRGEHGRRWSFGCCGSMPTTGLRRSARRTGRVGRIMSRDPAPRMDLFTAAREILDFNGYDIRQLRQMQ
jgi:apolipoprotein D and lipocalin family protein